MSSPNKPQLDSSLFYLIPICALLLVVSPLIVLSVLDCTFGPWSGEVCLLGSGSLALADQNKVGSSKRALHHFVGEEDETSLASFETIQYPAQKKQSSRKVVQKYSKLEKREAALAKVRTSIRKAAKIKKDKSVHVDPDYVPHGTVYHNANAFHRSYLEMEKLFKMYVYEDGEPPLYHSGSNWGLYSTEGRLIKEMENSNHFRTKDPDRALVYFLPFSVAAMVQYIYVDGDLDTYVGVRRAFIDYMSTISARHSSWNRSLGKDHFMLSCHDWGSHTTKFYPQVFNNSIRVLCNANTSEGFNPSKDASLPEIYLRTKNDIPCSLGGLPPSNRSIFAFFAGGVHGPIRHLLMEQWKGKDKNILVYEELPKNMSYKSMMQNSKYCLCPSGYEVASPRVVEAIYADCVPVLISDGYVPPFSDILNWEAFSVNVPSKDIPKLKDILFEIPQSKYLELQRGVKEVQRHFVINETPKRFDIFHMVIHSIWLRRLNVLIQD